MALEYFPCYHSYRRKIAKLSDQEVGRLFRSLLEYSETGETQELTGREAVAFDFIADDIDRARQQYEEKCRKNAENGKTGGRPKKQTVSKKSGRFFRNPKKPRQKQKQRQRQKQRNIYRRSRACPCLSCG